MDMGPDSLCVLLSPPPTYPSNCMSRDVDRQSVRLAAFPSICGPAQYYWDTYVQQLWRLDHNRGNVGASYLALAFLGFQFEAHTTLGRRTNVADRLALLHIHL